MVTNLSSSRASLTRTSLLGVLFNSRVQTMPFHWPVSHFFSEHTCRPSHTTKPRCAHEKYQTQQIFVSRPRAAKMRVQFMRTRGSRALLTCAACRNRSVAQPRALVCGRLKGALYIIQILCRRYIFWSYPAGLTIADQLG